LVAKRQIAQKSFLWSLFVQVVLNAPNAKEAIAAIPAADLSNLKQLY